MEKQIKNRYRQLLGKWGEDLALQFLQEQGYTLVARNFRTPDGEIDLILEKDGQLTMVEVKTRKNDEFGLPEDAVTDEKIEHLTIAAEWFLQDKPEYADNWRIDVVSIIGTPAGGEPQIDWFENVS